MTPNPGSSPNTPTQSHKPLKGVRVLSLSLNLPGPAALMRCRDMGATCTKLEPPAGDPMRSYSPMIYDTLHQGVRVKTLDLKTPAGGRSLDALLSRSDVLLTHPAVILGKHQHQRRK